MKITLMVTKDEEGFFIGQLKEFPQVISEGDTEETLVESIKDALSLHLDYLRDKITSKTMESSTEKEYSLSMC